MRQNESTKQKCPLCGHPATTWVTDKQSRKTVDGAGRARVYYRCENCQLVHAGHEFHLDPASEMARYTHHNNDTAQYRAYMDRLIQRTIKSKFKLDSTILDYGCGPIPVLSERLVTAGYRSSYWDPYFAPDTRPLDMRYDGIVLHEVVEHVADARSLFAHLMTLLEPDGKIVIATHTYPPDPGEFADWWYRADPTHISFYCAETFSVASGMFGLRSTAIERDLFALKALNSPLPGAGGGFTIAI